MGRKATKKLKAEMDKLMLEQLRRQSQPDPRLEAIMAGAAEDAAWHRGGMEGGQFKDVYKNKGIAPFLAVFQTAMANRDADRAGQGVRGKFTGSSGDKGYGQDLQLESQANRRTNAAGGLETALNNQYGTALNTLQGGFGHEANRMQSSISNLSQYSDKLQQRINSGFSWGKFGKGLLKFGMSVAGPALSGGLSGMIPQRGGGGGGGTPHAQGSGGMY